MINKRLILITGIVFILIAHIAIAARTNIDQTRVIDLEKFYEVPMIEVKEGDILNVDMQVTSGAAVDALLLKSSDYQGYVDAVKQGGTFNYVKEGSMKRQTTLVYSYKFNESGDYYLIIDNSALPKDGGPPMGQVEIKMKISVTSGTSSTPSGTSSETSSETSGNTPAAGETQKSPGFGFIFTIIAMSAYILIRKSRDH